MSQDKGFFVCMARLFVYSVLAGFAFLLSACFSKYIYTDKEIERYYADKPYKPTFKAVQYQKKQVHYTTFGDSSKPLLMLIHGAPGAWYTWMNFADNQTLREHFFIVIPDRPGYGKSGYGKAELNIHYQIGALQAILQRYPDNGLVLAGRSYGAPIAAALASLNNRRCTRLVFYSPVLSPYHEKKYWFSGIVKSPPFKWLLPKPIQVASDEKYAHLCQMKDALVYYKELQAPLIIVSGKKDRIAHSSNFSVCDSIFCRQTIYSTQLSGKGHFLTFKYPDFMSSLLYIPNTTVQPVLMEFSAKSKQGS